MSIEDTMKETEHQKIEKEVKNSIQMNSSYIKFIRILLIFLFCMHGFILGLFLETLQITLKKDFSYSEIGIFLLCDYPFALKLFWSPIVDTYHIRSIGLRRTWVISTQIIIAGLLMYLSYNINHQIENKKIYELSIICCMVIFFIATQEIAIDGWATTLCGKDVNN